MRNGELHAEYKYYGKDFVVDVADMGENANSRYEIIAMYADGRELACRKAETFSEAEQIYKHLLKEYPESEKSLSGKYAKLRDHLIIALAAGRTAETMYMNKHDNFDGGTCNFDSPTLTLARWNSKLVEQAAQEAGTHAWKWNCYGNIEFVFTPHTHAQGLARTVNAEAMQTALKELGYAAGMYYQMD